MKHMKQNKQFLIITPDYQMIKLEGNHYVTEYIQEYYAKDMESYCKEYALGDGGLMPTDVEDMSNIIGATDDGCKIYEVAEVIRTLQKSGAPIEQQEEMISFLSNLALGDKLKCPGDISDLLSETEEIYPTELLD